MQTNSPNGPAQLSHVRGSRLVLLAAVALVACLGLVLHKREHARSIFDEYRQQRSGCNDSSAYMTAAALPSDGTLQCGNLWQAEYTRMHAAMLRGDMEPRYLVAEGENGLADSLVGPITLLFVAVLQRRAFFLTFGDGGQYEWAFSSPNVNWTWDPSLESVESTRKVRLTTSGRSEPDAMHIKHGDVRELGSNATVLHVSSFLGLVLPLLDNPHHKAELFSMGLHPANAFACGIDFLLRLRPEALAPFEKEFQALSEPGTLKIGIQIRSGDQTFGQDHANMEFFSAFFDCAEQIERAQRRSEDQLVRYFLISDSVGLRKEAAETLGDKLMTSLTAAVGHTRRKGAAAEEMAAAMRTAAAEMWLYSLADFHIMTLQSGFGRLGSYMSGRWHQLYAIDYTKDATTPPGNRSCGAEDFDTGYHSHNM